ncbi:hypothetical protein LTR36_003913 [Oleoguttula mirabilis]|uniref:Nuclear distribution protein RO10 n=1 Tax=Oleoguttula mirabilis TaxID=1507867 RepID=A0AAV9JID4_9PEZI|nr:hypothetical protein LTR36_003913 [Oleoguttula mirabilis]
MQAQHLQLDRSMASKAVGADTLALLEERIRRVDYVLNGDNTARDTTEPSHTTGSATARLRTLERTLNSLASRSPAAADILAVQKAHPSLFHPTRSSTTTNTNTSTDLPPAHLAALVLAHAQLYTAVSAHLTQLHDTHLPDPTEVIKLVDLHPRIGKAQAKQTQQAREFAELRGRSARVVEQWYRVGVLEMGDQWAEWEERVREAEILVRRREAARRREEGMV